MAGILRADTARLNTIKSQDSDVTAMTIDTSGAVLKPNLPYFLVQSPTADATYTNQVIPYNNVIEDQGNNYDTTNYCFTAPITGVYMFSFTCNGMTTGADRAYIQRANNGSTYYNIDSRGETQYGETSNQGLHARGSAAVSDYYYMGLQVPLKVNSGGKVRVRVNAGSVNTFHANFFTGYLIG